jgi:CbiX
MRSITTLTYRLEHPRTTITSGDSALRYVIVSDLSPEVSPPAGLPQRRVSAAGPDSGAAHGGAHSGAALSSDAQPLHGSPGLAGSALPQRRPAAPDGGTGTDGLAAAPGALPRRTSATRRVGRHRSLHRISVSSDAPALVIAVPGPGADAGSEVAEQIAESASESCPGVDIRLGYLSGDTDTLADALEACADHSSENAPAAVVVPLLAGPHPIFDVAIERAIGEAAGSVMLAAPLGPHPLLAGALHDRLSEVGLARASRARGLNIAAGANGVIVVVADRGPVAIADAGVTAVLLAARLAIPAAPASFGDPASIDAALQRLREAGSGYPAIAPCVIGPETDPAEFVQLSESLGAPCAEPLGAHPAIAQLVSVRYGEALARISVASH